MTVTGMCCTERLVTVRKDNQRIFMATWVKELLRRKTVRTEGGVFKRHL